MPDEKKQQNKKVANKHEAKEQRKPRQSRSTLAPTVADKKSEKPKVPVVEKPAAPAEPGPEFYNSLKRETDDILKISEEENSKYKNKEIKSNWSKYEIPIETYNEIEEQESLGADYEKLIQAPLTIGGDFQFKHEKSWDLNTGPSLYDKYFEINMDNLAIAISTVPFHERNDLDKAMFSEIDLSNMVNRSTNFKSKYYNDSKKYRTPEMAAQESILSKLTSNNVSEEKNDKPSLEKPQVQKDNSKECAESYNNRHIEDIFTDEITEPAINVAKNLSKTEEIPIKDVIDDIDDLILEKVESNIVNKLQHEVKTTISKEITLPDKQESQISDSPEDLEKWLDDFLDD